MQEEETGTLQKKIFEDIRNKSKPALLVAHAPANATAVDCLTMDGAVQVGRDDLCDLPFLDATMSRVHFKISPNGEGHVLEDMGSKNGTAIVRALKSQGITYSRRRLSRILDTLNLPRVKKPRR